jgi:hypothetical protein
LKSIQELEFWAKAGIDANAIRHPQINPLNRILFIPATLSKGLNTAAGINRKWAKSAKIGGSPKIVELFSIVLGHT